MKRRNRFRSHRAESPDDSNPMVDVVFLLLVFFLFSFQVKMIEVHQQVRSAAKAEAAAGEKESEQKLLTLIASPQGVLAGIQLDEQIIEHLEQLGEELGEYPADLENAPRLLISPQAGLHYRHVIQAADVARSLQWPIELVEVKPGSDSGGEE